MIGDQWVENTAPVGWWPDPDFAEPWRRRELLWFFALRDLRVRYKQAVLGAAWAVIQPVAGAIAFTVLFNGLAGIEVDGDSYFVFALSGFIVWSYFSSAVMGGTMSILGNADLVSEVPFPKIVAPLATLVQGLADLAIGLVAVVVASLVTGTGLSLVGVLIGLPLGTVLLIVTAAGPILLFSAAVVKYRDVGMIVSFGLELFLFISPVAYPPELVPERLQTVQYLNPVAGCLALFRWAFAGSSLPAVGLLILSGASAIALLLAGWLYFRSSEHQFADII